MKKLNSFTFGPMAFILATILNTSYPSIVVEEKWSTSKELKTPESAFYDSVRNIIYVSNINKINNNGKDGDGFISKISLDRKIENLVWVGGLNDPKGMGIYKNSLFVTDLTEVIEISLPQGTIKKRYAVPGSKFLNDITIDLEGNIYISDTDGHKIFLLSKGNVSLWLDREDLNRPNGLLWEKQILIMASMGGNNVSRINPKTKEVQLWISETPAADGIVKDGKGNYFVSNWNGEVYFFKSTGEKEQILNTQNEKINAADIEYIPKNNLLLVPTFFDNRLIAYEVK